MAVKAPAIAANSIAEILVAPRPGYATIVDRVRDVHCYHCSAESVVDGDGRWQRCPGCDRRIDAGIASRLFATIRVDERFADLDPDLKRALQAALDRHLKQLRAAGRQLAAPDQPPTEPPPAREIANTPAIERPPSLWKRLGPVFAENLLFALAGFLLIAGAVFFATTAWTTMSGLQQKLAVAGGLTLFCGLLQGAALPLERVDGLRTAERVLRLVAIAAANAALAVAAQIVSSAPVAAAGIAAAALGAGCFAALRLCRREADDAPRPIAFVLLAATILGAPATAGARFWSAVVAGLVLLAVARPLRRCSARGAWLSFTTLALAVVAFAVTQAMVPAGSLAATTAPLGVVLAAIGAAMAMLEPRVMPTAHAPTLVAATAAGLAGAVLALGDPRALMAAGWFGAAAAAVGSLRLDKPAQLIPALLLAGVGYLFLGAPFRELVIQLRDSASAELGYAPGRLPLSFYGVTFVPYLALIGAVAAWLERRDLARHARVAIFWLLAVAGALAVMSLTLGTDLRAPAAVLSADGAVLVGLGWLLRRNLLIVLGAAGIVAGSWCLTIYVEPFWRPFAALGGALALAAIGWRARLPGLGAAAVGQAAAAAWLSVGAFGLRLGDPSGAPVAAAVAAIGATASRATIVRKSATLVAGGAVLWIALARLATLFATIDGVPATAPPLRPTATIAVAALLGAVAWWTRGRGQDRVASSLSECAAAAAVLVPLAIVDVFVPRVPGYALGFDIAGVALLGGGLAWRARARIAFGLSALGLAYLAGGFLLALLGHPIAAESGIRIDAWLELAPATRALALAAATLALLAIDERLRPFASFLACAGAVAAATCAWPETVASEHRATVTLLLTAGFLATSAPNPLAGWRRGVRGFAMPVLVLTALGFGLLAAIVTIEEPTRVAVYGVEPSPAWPWIAVGFAVAAAAFDLQQRPHRFGVVSFGALLLAVFDEALLSQAVHGSREVLWRPDLEWAVIAAMIAWTGRARLVIPVGVGAALLTHGEPLDPTTPGTLTVLVVAPVVLARQRASVAFARLAALTALIAAGSWVNFAEPTDALRLPLLALIASAWAWLAPMAVARLLSTPRRFDGLAVIGWVVAAIALGMAAAAEVGRDDTGAIVTGCAAVLLGGGRIAIAMRFWPWLLHLVIASVLGGWAWLAAQSAALAAFDGVHHLGLPLLGASLFIVAGTRTTPLAREALRAGYTLSVLGVLASLLLGSHTSALFLAAAALTVGRMATGQLGLTWGALGAFNAGLFSLWYEWRVFDPSFYGVPAGLSLLIATELAGARLAASTRTTLRASALTAAYASIAVQVARVDEPLHALALFGLGLLAIGFGLWRRRTVFLIAGVAAVVIDVIAYLARHGFERDFLGSLLLLAAGATVLGVAVYSAKRRARGQP